jgi:hypothetical protein
LKTHENKWAGTIVEGQFVFSSNRYDSPYSGIMFELVLGGIDEANKLEEWMGIKIQKIILGSLLMNER